MLFDAKIIELIHKKAPDFFNQCPHPIKLLTPIINSIQNQYTHNPFTFSTHPPSFSDQYTAIGIDGSQLYPDRHNAISCFLLHIGAILIEYGKTTAKVEKEGYPFLFSSWDTFQDTVASHDIVDAERFLHELQLGLATAQTYQKKNGTPCIIFIDGPLLFWHLRQKPASFVTVFSARYQAILNEYKQYRIPLVGYISSPGSKELVTYIKQYAPQEKLQSPQIQQLLSFITDTTLLSLFLEQQHQTDLFISQTRTATQLTEDMYFYYYNIGSEYARIELPKWITQDAKVLSFVFQAVTHQIQNGFGYPTVLGLAHECAVIKNEDRILFFTLLHKALQTHKTGQFSQKQAKKEAGNVSKFYFRNF
jgi:hypothetical protein